MTDIGWARADAPRVRRGPPTGLEAQAVVREQPRLGKDAALMLDITGRISAANAAAALLLGRPPGTLCGLAATALMPQLPFAADTPGYNMAYAIFHTGDARWQPHQAIAADGRRVAVELLLACSSLEGRRVITLSLRPAAPQSREAP